MPRSFQRPQRGSSLASSSLWGLLAALGIPWLVDTSLQSLPLPSRDSPHVYLCLGSLPPYKAHLKSKMISRPDPSLNNILKGPIAR